MRPITFALLLLVSVGPGTAFSATPAAAAATPALVEGQDYARIPSGSPLSPQPGTVEVAELFNYACPACNGFSPLLRAWQAKAPAYVHVIYVPTDFRPDFVQYAHAYYAADSFGIVEKSHDAVFAAIHQSHKLPGEGAKQDAATIARFYAQFGVNAADFQKAMDSFTVNMKTGAASQFAARSQVSSTPSLVVDGKYLVLGTSWQDSLRIAGQLAARIHAAGKP